MKHTFIAPQCLSSGPDRHHKPFSSEAQPWLDALKRQAARWGESFELIERIIAYQSAPGLNRPPDPDDPIKYVLSIEILGLPQDSEALKQSLKDDDDLFDTWTFFQPDGLRSIIDEELAREIGNLDEWIVYPCALGEELIDVHEKEAWLVYDRMRAVDVDTGNELAMRARSQRDLMLSAEGRTQLTSMLDNLEGHIRGQELIVRWDLYPHELAHCLVLGLQAYSMEDLSPVGSMSLITSRMMEAARRAFQSRAGTKSAIYPRYHISADYGDLLPSRFIPFVFDQPTGEFPTEQSIEDCHLKLLFRIEDVEKFEEEYGLGPKIPPWVSASTSTEDSNNEEKTDILCFYRSGDYWMVGHRGKEKHIKNTKGMGYLHILLSHPGQRISCRDLYHNFGISGDGVEKGHLYDTQLEIAGSFEQVLSDSKAKTAVEEALTERTVELKELDYEDSLNPEDKETRKECLISEIAKLQNYLAGSRNRFSSVNAEDDRNVNLRTNVKKSLDAAIDKILGLCPDVSRFLNSKTVSTGYDCAYGLEMPLLPRWILSPP